MARASKEHAHELIDRMAPGQVTAVVNLLELLLDPLSRTLATADYDDEPETGSDASAIGRGEKVVAHEQVLEGLGLTLEDFERMGSTPLAPEK